MVAVIPAASAATVTHLRNQKNPSIACDDLPNPSQSPLNPSERDNAPAVRRPRIKEVTSRYLSCYSSSASSTTTSTSSSSSSTAISATSNASSFSSTHLRRFPSPLSTPRASNRAPTLPHPSCPKRSQSVDRTRPTMPRSDQGRLSNASPVDISCDPKALCTTTRSLSVSFQGESFFYHTSKAKVTTANSTRKPTPERRRLATTPIRNGRLDIEVNGVSELISENSRPGDHHRWTALQIKQSNPLTRSLDYSLHKKDPIFSTVKLLQHSMILEEGRRPSFDGGDHSTSSDTDSVSSGSNSGAYDSCTPAHSRASPRGICVPAKFWQETNSRFRRLPASGTPQSTPLLNVASAAKLLYVKKSSADNATPPARTASSPLRGPIRYPSPSKVVYSPSSVGSSPSRTKSNGTVAMSVAIGQLGNAPSMLSFASEVRRGKKGESRIEEAHTLRLLHNRHLQWRYANARSRSSLFVQKLTAEKKLYDAWVTISEMRDSITIKRIKLHLLSQKIKLASILDGQIAYLEEWSLVDRDHSNFLSGAIEALRASILRLPVVSGAKVDVQDVKDAVGSAVDVMQAMGSSICSVLLKVDRLNYRISELARIASQEKALLDQCRVLLCTIAALHVQQSSLRGHLLQLKLKPSRIKL